MPSHVLGRILLQDVARSSDVVCRQKVRDWEAEFGVVEAGVHAWPVWGVVAEALVRGCWHADVSVRF